MLFLTQIAGSVNIIRCFLLKQLLILCVIVCTVDAGFTDMRSGSQFVRHRKRWLSPHGAPKLVLAPAEPPNYGPLVTSAHSPSNSHFSKPSMRKSETAPPVAGFTPPRLADIAPSQYGAGALPTGLAQPPLSPHASSKTSFYMYL